MTHPDRLEPIIRANRSRDVIIDEIQRVPALLNEVHRLIESQKSLRFVLTGSSARKLRRGGVNLLAGRAFTLAMHPLTSAELGHEFSLAHALRWGHLPMTFTSEDPERYLKSYVGTYLREEVQQEALVRNLATFSRFLEAASFSQSGILSVQRVADDCGVDRKTAEAYFGLLEDLLLGVRLPVFTRRAKRKLTAHPKFYFFDAGVFRAIRPMGPLDSATEADGAALETLVMQELRATIGNLDLDYQIYFWRAQSGLEVDFVLYGKDGFYGIEVKRTSRFHESDLKSLRVFLSDYPEARGVFVYGGERRLNVEGVDVVPVGTFLRELATWLKIQ